MASSRRGGIGKYLGSCVVALGVHGYASAGSVEGPYVAWVNLSANPAPVDARIKRHRDSGEVADACWGHGSILYMRRQPVGLTKDLARRAVLDKDPRAMRALGKILQQPMDEFSDGLDGVIVYDDAKGPTFYGYTTGKTRVKVHKMSDLGRLEDEVCAVVPPITRAP